MLVRLAAIFGFMLIVCTGAGEARAAPDFVTESEIRNCRFLKSITVSSRYGKNLGSWLLQARASASREASALGASHIVLGDYKSSGEFSGIMTASAYDCGSRAELPNQDKL